MRILVERQWQTESRLVPTVAESKTSRTTQSDGQKNISEVFVLRKLGIVSKRCIVSKRHDTSCLRTCHPNQLTKRSNDSMGADQTQRKWLNQSDQEPLTSLLQRAKPNRGNLRPLFEAQEMASNPKTVLRWPRLSQITSFRQKHSNAYSDLL
jgi:hypothetical protein